MDEGPDLSALNKIPLRVEDLQRGDSHPEAGGALMAEDPEEEVLPPHWRRILAVVRHLEVKLGVEEDEAAPRRLRKGGDEPG